MSQSSEALLEWLQLYDSFRGWLLDILTDEDLCFQPGGDNMTLGALCREMGDTEYAYIQSFKTFTQDFDYCHPDAEVERSVEKLKAWYATLDEELYVLVGGFSDEALQKIIKRDAGFEVTVETQVSFYREALVIFYGKVSIFLRLLEKPLPGPWPKWIG